MRRLPVVTNSSITTFRRCPKEYYYKYVLLRKSNRKPESLRFGSFFHIGLNAWWCATGDSFDKVVNATDAMRVIADNVEEHLNQFELVKAEELMTGYTARWGSELIEGRSTEHNFRFPHRSGKFDIAGSIDGIVQKGNSVYLMEHKTTSSDISYGSNYWTGRVSLDSQVSTYLSAVKLMGLDVKSMIYDVIRKPGIVPAKSTPDELKKYTKPTKSEPVPRLYANMRETDETTEEYRIRVRSEIYASPDKYYQRQELVRTIQELESNVKDIAFTFDMISACESAVYWPKHVNSCERYGRICEFHDVCSGTASIQDDTRFVDKTKQHEELSV